MVKTIVEASARWWCGRRMTFKAAGAVAGASLLLGVLVEFQLGDAAGQMISGATFLAAAMVNALLRVWSWADSNDTQVDKLEGHLVLERRDRQQLRDRFDALEKVQVIAAVATVMSVVLIVVLLVAVVTAPDAAAAGLSQRVAHRLASIAAMALATSVAACLVGIVAETVNVGFDALRSARTAVGSQSGTHG